MPIYQPTYQQQAQEEMIEAAMPKNPLEGLSVRGNPTKAQRRTGKPPSPKQVQLILRLVREKDLDTLSHPWPALRAALQDTSVDRALWVEDNLTGGWEGTASKLIDDLFQARKVAAAAAVEEAPEGIHYLDGTVYKVQVAHHGSGRKYAKQLDPDGGGWEYLGRGGVFKQLSADTLMTLEDAQEFGRLYGMCCKCGATLTDESSIAAGIGPVCAQSF